MSASEKAAEKVAQTKATTNGQGAALKETTAPVVYIGPTIPGVVMTNTILKEKGNELEQICEKMPEIKTLMVPAADLARARKELETEGTPAKICYNRAVEHLAEKGVRDGDL